MIKKYQILNDKIDETKDSEKYSRLIIEGKSIAKKNDDRDFLFFFTAKEAFLKKDFSKAKKLFCQASEINERSIFYRYIGISTSRLRKEDEAIEYYDKAILLSPEDNNNYREKGISLAKLRKGTEAVEMFDRSIYLNPKDYKSYSQKGIYYSYTNGHLEKLNLLK